MNVKFGIPAVAVVLLIIMGGYFLLNPSYEKSIKAKYYFETGDYTQALKLSREAFSMNVYNRMASTVMAQSITSLKYVSYVNDAKKYMEQINEIATHDTVSSADRAKIRLICEIMVNSYIKLAPSVITDKKLVEDSANYYSGFEKLLEKVDK